LVISRARGRPNFRAFGSNQKRYNEPMKRNVGSVKAVIFDFDGTIADSFEVFVHAIEVVLKRKPFTASEIKELRQYSLPEVMKKLNIKKWQLPMLVIKGRREVDRHMNDVTAFEDIPEMLAKLSENGYKLYIVSSHAPEGIQTFLDKYSLGQHFSGIYGKVSLFGKAKTLKKLQRKHGYANTECIFVGDEVRDIQAARKAGIDCIAVGWGFNAPSALKAHHPKLLASSPVKLIHGLMNIEA
jgi:phosphoglycolate phosphatase